MYMHQDEITQSLRAIVFGDAEAHVLTIGNLKGQQLGRGQ